MSNYRPDALIIFAKWPEPGRVKTRLSPPLTHDEAAELYRCMLQDTLDATSGIAGVCRLIFFDGPEERADDFRMLAPDAEVYRQHGTDLGERLLHAFETAFAMGFRSVGVIGTDSPHMPVERVTNAFLLLNEGNADVVIGPTEDGGYYLLGMGAMHLELFRDIPWSTSGVMTTTTSRAKSAALRIMTLPIGYDLDSINDLKKFIDDPNARKKATKTASILRILPT